jgi:flagellar L-ring protein FlgH
MTKLTFFRSPVTRMMVVSLGILQLAGCNTMSRLSEIGDGPELTTIENPIAAESYQPVSMPMPLPQAVPDNPNSLWRSGAKAFFKDHRAKEVGDILTVKLELNDSATLSNVTTRDRVDTEDVDVTNLLGFEDKLDEIFPETIGAPGSIAEFGNTHSTSGDGGITRSEAVDLELAAVVTQILPNGNLVLMGRQEVIVNSEMRELMVTGVIRTSDIDTDNTIEHTKIAEMRVAYGGRGSLSQVQQPRWGMQVWDVLFPF